MTRARIAVLTGLLLLPPLAQAQTAFDVKAYGQFLSAHQNLGYSHFLGMYRAGTFCSEVPGAPSDPADLAALDSAYSLTSS